MKKSIFLAITVALAITMGTSAFADMRTTYTVDATASTFEHAIDFYTPHYGWGYYEDDHVGISEDGGSLSYSHNLNEAPGNLDIPTTNVVTSADLDLEFYSNDGAWHWKRVGWGHWVHDYYEDYEEYVRFGFDGVNWIDMGELVDEPDQNYETYNYELVVGVLTTLNTTGQLDIHIDVTNNGGDIGLCSSTLSGSYEAVQNVPVPGAVLLGILGLGAAGARLRKRS